MIGEKIDDDSILSSRFSLDIFNLTLTEEKELFSTVNGKVKTPHKNRILYLSNDIECKLLREIIAQSDLDGKIECVRNNAYKDGKLTKFSTLYDSLFGQSGVYGAGHITDDNYEEYLSWLTEFYNELLKTREDFNMLTSEQKANSKQKSMALEELSWWGYATLAEKLKGIRKWKSSLNTKMNKTIKVDGGISTHFLDKSLPIWHATVIKPKYNFITKTQEIGTSVTNSNATRNSIKKIFYVTLF
ncbi:hypothetical protein PQE66_gp110 [Bacillus phage PBC2]|uniref:Uncharacterized protein n=1 Tax=Bacillus phage PBC2 TaxID=1675029 RepID=A0A218KBY8_9CAUD|nr:hypothetical protein PQE66_gp110 [Bacillus phage PBC2]AKQ08425.1 hypothetical protein PBC2_110 [Bacillus phage PBC2]